MEVRDNAGNIFKTSKSLILDTLFIKRAEFTNIVNPLFGNPELPTSKVIKIKRGYNFTFEVETIGNPDYVEWEFNGQKGHMKKVKNNNFVQILQIEDDNSKIDSNVLPIYIKVHRNSDNTEKAITLKVNIVGSASQDYNINLTN